MHASNVLRGCIPYKIDKEKIVPLKKRKDKIHILANIWLVTAYTCIMGINIVLGKENISHKLFGMTFSITHIATQACRHKDDWISIPNWMNAVIYYEKEYVKCKWVKCFRTDFAVIWMIVLMIE